MNKDLDPDHKTATHFLNIFAEAARLVGEVRNLDNLNEFCTDAFKTWIGQQEEDLLSQSEKIRKIQDILASSIDPEVNEALGISEGRIKDTTARAARLKNLQSSAKHLVEVSGKVSASLGEYHSDIANLKTGEQNEALMAKMAAYADVITVQLDAISRLTGELSPSLQTAKATPLLRAAASSSRPIKDALAKDVARLTGLYHQCSAAIASQQTNAVEENVEEKVPPSRHQQLGPADVAANNSGVNPQIQLRRKELGTALSDAEVIRRTEAYFRSLWDLDICQSHCGTILFFEPSVSRGINIHDLLGLSNTDTMLVQAKTQIMARFGRRG